jgi:hypothetical protein
VLCCVVLWCGVASHTYERREMIPAAKTAKAKCPSFTVNLIILGLARRSLHMRASEQSVSVGA